MTGLPGTRMPAPEAPAGRRRPGRGAAAADARARSPARVQRSLLRNGEQLVLTLLIPLLLLFPSACRCSTSAPRGRIDFVVPGIIALAVMSTAFTGLAIATGFERKYGVLKRLGATPLPRSGLIAAKTATVSPWSWCSSS